MLSDRINKNTLVPLILRITLAAIFLYHGLDKVTGRDHHSGATWATAFWEQKAAPPASLTAKLDRLTTDATDPTEKERIASVGEKIKAAYLRDAGRLPEGLENTGLQLAVAWAEVLGGGLLLIGFLTRFAAAVLIVIQIGAIATVTSFRGFSSPEGLGYEYNLALVAMCLAVALAGAGTCSVDGWLWSRGGTRSASHVSPGPRGETETRRPATAAT